MSTQLFFTSVASDFSTGNLDTRLDGTATSWSGQVLSTSRGSGVTSSTATAVAGPTNGVELGSGSRFVWYTSPIAAQVDIGSNSILWNLRAAESTTAANAAVNCRVEVVDGATGAFTFIGETLRTLELGATEAAASFSTTPAVIITCKKGDRLRVRVFFDDAGTMAAGGTLTFWYNGTTSAASGDSFLTIGDTVTFVSEPAGTQLFMTDTASPVSNGNVNREAWTSRGAGVQTDVTNSVNGPVTFLQVTDTAGGTVVDWYTRPLLAVTLGGAVRVNVRFGAASGLGQTAAAIEIARVAGDGSSAVVWSRMTCNTNNTVAAETVVSFLAGGNDLAISTGQRLRIRIGLDDLQGASMVTGGVLTSWYAGTSSAASGDTFVTLTSTLTELVPAVPRTPPYPPLLAQ